jgi:hypothetical protein
VEGRLAATRRELLQEKAGNARLQAQHDRLKPSFKVAELAWRQVRLCRPRCPLPVCVS